MSSYLITGCSRGLGLELVKQLLSAPSSSVSTIITTSRSQSPSTALNHQIQISQGRVHYVQLDVTDTDSILSASQRTGDLLKDHGLDVLINNAGAAFAENNTPPCDFSSLQSTFETNVLAVHNVSRAFLPLLEQGTQKKIVNISSTMGSLSYNEYTKAKPMQSYKISKAALNMLTVQWANDLESKGFTVFCMSPGWLRTDMGGQDADLDPEVGAKATMDVIYGATPKDNAAFRDIYVEGSQMYTGKNPPW